MIGLRLLTRPGCHLCDDMRAQVDALLADAPHAWETVDVDADPALAARFGQAVPVLFVNGRLFAKTRLPRLGVKARLRHAAARTS
jgi:thioredoxin-like negative regulator of GroEL